MQHSEVGERRVRERRRRDRRICERRVLSSWGSILEMDGAHRERRVTERRGGSWCAGERRRRERRRTMGGTTAYRLRKPEDMAITRHTPVPDQTAVRACRELSGCPPVHADVTDINRPADHD
jgi:hypothetical protein